DVARSIKEKMVRRHPHVFGKKKVSGIKEIWSNWEEIKKDEAVYRSILDSIPKAMPALYRAEKSQKKAARAGFDWDKVAGAWDKVEEELEEIKALLRNKKSSKNRLEEEIGDLLFAVVNVARKTNISAENALQLATKKFSKRFLHIEEHAKKHGKRLKDMTLEQMDGIWNEAKKLK
ncbi:MAG: MazG family protein, partial [Candidatus Margulisiibacteriota bacterium]